jgi:hypothetical protein
MNVDECAVDPHLAIPVRVLGERPEKAVVTAVIENYFLIVARHFAVECPATKRVAMTLEAGIVHATPTEAASTQLAAVRNCA